MNIQKLKQYKIFENQTLLRLDLLKNQGFCNINYCLKTSKKEYLVRTFKSLDTVNISREFEYNIQKKAYKKNIAAKPLLLDEENSFMVCEYLKGKHKKSINKKEIKCLSRNIKKLHKIKSDEKQYDLKKVLKFYKKTLHNKKKAHESINICKKEIQRIKRYKNRPMSVFIGLLFLITRMRLIPSFNLFGLTLNYLW